MSAYYGYAMPMKMITKIYNAKQENGNTLRQEIAKVDSSFETYLNKLFVDIQGNTMSKEGIDKLISKIRGWGANAALGLNPKVWVNQLVSLFAARGNGIYYKNIVKGIKSIATGKKADYDIMYKYAPMTHERARDGGNIDVGLLREGGGVLGRIDKITSITTAPIGKIDNAVVFGVWNACLEQTKGTYADYSDEHYKAAAKLLEETIIKTQANYTPLYRPEILRTQSSFLQLSTMFMSEPLQVYSQIVAAVDQISIAKYMAKNATTEAEKAEAENMRKSALKNLKGVATSLIVDSLLLVLINQLFKWVKGRDDEEKFWESIGSDMIGNVTGMFPFVRDIQTAIQGYDITNMAYTGLGTLANTFIGFKELVTGDTDDLAKNLRNSILGVSQIFGIPLRNLEAYTKGIVTKFNPALAYKYNNVFYSQTYSKDLAKAVESGNTELSESIIESMMNDKGLNTNDKITKELLRLYETDNTAFPTAVNTIITYDGTTYTLMEYQKSRFENIYKQSMPIITSLISSAEYRVLSDEAKAKAIKKVYEGYYSRALKNILDIENPINTLNRVVEIKDTALIMSAVSAMESDILNGKAVNGSKKKKAIEYVMKTELSQAQKLFMLMYLGYTIQDGDIKGVTAVNAKTIVKNYINSREMPITEKKALMEKVGLVEKSRD